jgi:putative DNA primase/helicase
VSVAEVARIWQAEGVSVIPILANQTKRPAIRWSPYIATAPSLEEVHDWWGNGKPWGLALICGAVSGNLEMTEVEGRAMVSEKFEDIINRMDELGVGHVWDMLYGPDGFTETSPSGGIHFLYRISDHEVPGNTKIASNEEGLCLAETRGHGGYVITAPTTGICHPSGEPWQLREGQYGKLPTVTWVERNLFHEALRLALDESAPTAATGNQVAIPSPITAPVVGSLGSLATGSSSPGDDFEAHTDWAEILEPHGWHLETRHGAERHWTRPGKDRRDGSSATTGRAHDRDRLYVFSTSTVFQSEVPYTKFGAWALLNFNGDHSAAARDLARRGYGDRLPIMAELDELESASSSVEYSLDDVGNGYRLAAQLMGRYRYVWEEKRWYRFDGRCWVHDFNEQVVTEVVTMTEVMRSEAAAQNNLALSKWAAKSRAKERITAAVTLARSAGLTHSASEWNPYRGLLNCPNGVLNLGTGKLLTHDANYLMTHVFGAEYVPGESCEQFEDFMAKALPDPAMRSYVQRALGYSLLGDADQRSLFLIFGPSGTGKSTLMETMRDLFGDYATTAQAGTFRAPKNDKGPSNDLHELRGKRFVTTSETAEGANFDEDLLKRMSGRDRVRSRALYQESVEWTPECTIWVATNNPPKFNSDDDAIWRRTKLIPFTTVFRGEHEVFDYARKVLLPEGSGILNWLLAGLTDFLDSGLGEPQLVMEMASEQRAESDSVARFIGDELADGFLILEPTAVVRIIELYSRYTEWAKRAGERPVGNRRFNNRLTSNFPDVVRDKVEGHLVWFGIGRGAGVGITGSI